MKYKLAISLTVAIVSAHSAHATVIYDNINSSYNWVMGCWDGGAGDIGGGTNYGLQTGQVVTSTVTGSLTTVSGAYLTASSNTLCNGALVQVYNFASGVVGSLVGQQQCIPTLQVIGPSSVFGSDWDNIVTASCNISGIQAGQDYLVTMQPQGPNWGWLESTTNGHKGAYNRDYSSFNYSGAYGYTDWRLGDFNGVNGDTLMKLDVTPVPEPASFLALLAGGGFLLKRKRK